MKKNVTLPLTCFLTYSTIQVYTVLNSFSVNDAKALSHSMAFLADLEFSFSLKKYTCYKESLTWHILHT